MPDAEKSKSSPLSFSLHQRLKGLTERPSAADLIGKITDGAWIEIAEIPGQIVGPMLEVIREVQGIEVEDFLALRHENLRVLNEIAV